MKIKSVKKVNELNGSSLDHYDLTDTDDIIYHVPVDEGNKEYQAILAWVAEGNTIQEAD